MKYKFRKYNANLGYDDLYVYSYGTKIARRGITALYELGYWSVTSRKHFNYAAKELGLDAVHYPNQES